MWTRCTDDSDTSNPSPPPLSFNGIYMCLPGPGVLKTKIKSAGSASSKENNLILERKWNRLLTGMSFIVHVKFEAGFDLPAVQLARRLSPTLNRPRLLCTCTIGRCSGVSAEWDEIKIENISRKIVTVKMCSDTVKIEIHVHGVIERRSFRYFFFFGAIKQVILS